jgi:chromosome segregation ATPase
MTPDEWIPVGESAELIGEPIDRLFKLLELREERNRLKKDLTDLVDLYKDQGHRIAELTADVADRDAAIIGLNEDLEELNFHLSEARAQLAKIEEEKTPKENLKNKLARLRSLFPGEKQ